MRDLLRDFLRTLRREPFRAFLTLFGIVLGSASIVFLASVLGAADQSLSKSSQDAEGDDISRVEWKNPGPIAQSRTLVELSQRDVDALAGHEKLAEGQAAGSYTEYHQEASVNGKRKLVGIQTSVDFLRIAKLEVLFGRTLRAEDEGERVCVIGYDIFQDLFEGKWPLPTNGLVLNGATRFTVIGVFKKRPPMGGGGGDDTWRYDRKVYISNTTFLRSVRPRRAFDEIAIRHDAVDGRYPNLKTVAERLTPYLQTLHLGIKNFEFDALNKGMQLESVVVTSLGAIMFACGLIALVVGGVNVMNAQLVALHERAKEYGIRRALGLSARELMRNVLIEASLYTFIGGVTGVALGLGAAKLLAYVLTATLLEWPFVVKGWSVAVALGMTMVTGGLAGYLPARRASQIVPSECLRSE